jgi:hypothetical protein
MIYKRMILLIFFYSSSALAADSLGRLFLTPDQRAQLETVRAQRDRRLPAVADTTEAAPAPVPQGPDVVTYNGIVRRSDGKSTVWINGKPVNERNRVHNDSEVNVLGVRRDGAVSVAIPQAGRTGSLKVGQSLEVTSGVIEESYLRRATLARPQEKNLPQVPAQVTKPVISTEAVTAAQLLSAIGAARPTRESDTKEADPDSGAAPAIRVPKK